MAKKATSVSPKVKYVLVPGWVVSAKDGESHFIDPYELARLYGLERGTYRTIWYSPSVPEAIKQAESMGLTVLKPDPSGEYKLPKAGPGIDLPPDANIKAAVRGPQSEIETEPEQSKPKRARK